jgi:predicted transcriptional regulator
LEGTKLASYRSKLHIIADILYVVSKGAKKTQIMYQANLSYKLLTKYLIEIRKAYLIQFEGERKSYVLTQKGEEFLVRYREYSKRNRHVEKQITEVRSKKKILEDLCTANQASVE